MNYQQIAPPEHLKPYVRYFWTLDNDMPAGSVASFLAIADGTPGVIFQESESGQSWQEHTRLPPVFLYGQTIRHATIHTPCPFRSVGVYFYPHAVKTVFGIDAADITDGCLDLNTFPASYHLLDKLLELPHGNARIRLLCDYLWMLIHKHDHLMLPAMHYAVGKIVSSGGNIPLSQLRDEVNMTERTMERRFRELIGMSPKLFSRIRRFQSSLDQIRSQAFRNLSDIAFDQEYADQSHFVRTFKEFTGETPARFSRKTNEIVENFPLIIL